MWEDNSEEQLVKESGKLVKILAKHGLLKLDLMKKFWSLTIKKSDNSSKQGVVRNAFAILYRQDNLTYELLKYITDEIDKLVHPNYVDRLKKEHFNLLATNTQFRGIEVHAGNIKQKVVNIFWKVIYDLPYS